MKTSTSPKVMKLTGITLQGRILHESYRFIQKDAAAVPAKLPLGIDENTTGQEAEVFCMVIVPDVNLRTKLYSLKIQQAWCKCKKMFWFLVKKTLRFFLR